MNARGVTYEAVALPCFRYLEVGRPGVSEFFQVFSQSPKLRTSQQRKQREDFATASVLSPIQAATARRDASPHLAAAKERGMSPVRVVCRSANISRIPSR